MSKVHALLDAFLSQTATLTNKTLTSPVINTPTINDPTYTGVTTIDDPEITGTVAGSATYTTPQLDTPTFTAVAIDIPASSTMGTVALVDLSSSQTLTTKTITAPVLGGSITGTYTLAGTPTITAPTITTPLVTGAVSKAFVAGAAGSVVEISSKVTALTDNTNATFFTVTIPNAVHAGALELDCTGCLGDGDSTHMQRYHVSISRIAGAATSAVASAAIGSVKTTGATGDATLTASLGSVAGAVGATQTFTVLMKVARSAGASANHVGVIHARLFNAFATGITIA